MNERISPRGKMLISATANLFIYFGRAGRPGRAGPGKLFFSRFIFSPDLFSPGENAVKMHICDVFAVAVHCNSVLLRLCESYDVGV